MMFKIIVHEKGKMGEVTGEIPDYPHTPLNRLVDTLQMALLEAGFSFEAEVLRIQYEGGEDAEE